MFTGIVEELGTVTNMTGNSVAMKLTISAHTVLSDVKLGDSIAVNGTCLTVTSFTEHSFTVDVMPETMRATSLHIVKRGSLVNLERAMAANGRFGGHFVSGHIDGTGTIVKKTKQANAVYYEIALSKSLLRYCFPKGSISIDGTSLTIFYVSDTSITVSLIPHTLSESVLGMKNAGDIVNIECDMVGKYVERFLSAPAIQKNSVTESFLQENGFM